MKRILTCLIFLAIIVSLSGCATVLKESEKKAVISETQEVDKSENTDMDKSKGMENETKEVKSQDETKEKTVINKKIVVIDPGHSSNGNKGTEKQSPDSDLMKIKDPGGAQGIFTNVPEYVINMKVALKLKSLLEKNNITVIMTKIRDSESPGNIERAEVGNNNNANLCIRIHCDSSDSKSVKGASMLVPAPIGYAKDISEISKKYGQIILKDLVLEVGMNNKGVVERSDLTGFNWSKVPVVLIEMGFMSNIEEDKLLIDDNYQSKLATGLCNGILESLK